MAKSIDPSMFVLHNVVDTCSVWNILSSKTLFSRAKLYKCTFIITQYVNYECLHKKRTTDKNSDKCLMKELISAQDSGNFKPYCLSVEDLQDLSVLRNRKKLGKGELSSIAFAKKINQAIMTDDQKARTLAEDVLADKTVQTTPHLLGWLIFNSYISDSDYSDIVSQHVKNGGQLKPHLEHIYNQALDYRLKATPPFSGT